MDLDQYLTMTGKTETEFAREIQLTPQAVNYYRNRQRRPRDESIIERIYAATNGLVTPNDFYPLPVVGGGNTQT